MRYIPGFIPDDMTRREFEKIAQALESANERLTLQVLHKAPEKYREGTIVCADGVNFNPGAGAGFYGYHSGTWNKLG